MYQWVTLGRVPFVRLSMEKKIKSVRLTNADVGNVGLEAISGLLQKNTCLQRLRLNNNRFGPTGVSTLCSVLKDNITLHLCDISHNDIGNQGATSIAEMLSSNETLESMSIASGKIGNEGSIKLANYFEITQNRSRPLRIHMEDNNNVNAIGKAALMKAKNNPFFVAKLEKMEFRLQPTARSRSLRCGKGTLTEICEEDPKEPVSLDDSSLSTPKEMPIKVDMLDEEKKKCDNNNIKKVEEMESKEKSYQTLDPPVSEESSMNYGVMSGIGLVLTVVIVLFGITAIRRQLRK